jgi:hypothetical protein
MGPSHILLTLALLLLALCLLIHIRRLTKNRCSHCIQLAPTWETLAEVMSDVAEDIIEPHAHKYNEEDYEHAKKVALPVMIAKIDCVAHHEFCREQMIMAYPTLRLFVDGERWPGGDYRGHRTVVAMADYLAQIEDTHKTEKGSVATKTVETAHQGTFCDDKLVVGRMGERPYTRLTLHVLDQPTSDNIPMQHNQRPRIESRAIWKMPATKTSGPSKSNGINNDCTTATPTKNIPVVNCPAI